MCTQNSEVVAQDKLFHPSFVRLTAFKLSLNTFLNNSVNAIAGYYVMYIFIYVIKFLQLNHSTI